MFSQNLLSCLTKFYTYPWSRITFLMPFNCQSSMRACSSKKQIPISYGQNQLEKRKTSFSTQQSYTMNSLSGRGGKKGKSKRNYVPRNYATEYATPNRPGKTFIDRSRAESIEQNVSITEGIREFFSHPLTWDRNNGYLNILLGLSIFGYCFCTTSGGETKVSYDAEKKK